VTSQGALVVNPKPTAAVPSLEVCAGSSTELCANAASGTPPYKYLWSTGETSECITVAQAGPYSVTVTDSKGCQATSQGALAVNPNPTAAVPSLEVCAGSSAELCANAASGTPPYKYLWSTGETSACITVTQAGPYSVTVTDSKGCQATSQGALAVNPKPTAAAPSLEVCAGASAQLCANEANGTPPYKYLWSTGETSECITVAQAGPYSVTVTDAKGCQATSQGALVVNPKPTAAVPSLEVCAGGSA